MFSLPRPATLFLCLTLIIASGMTGLAFYSSGQVETGLKSLAAHTQCKGLFTVRNLVHDRGLFPHGERRISISNLSVGMVQNPKEQPF